MITGKKAYDRRSSGAQGGEDLLQVRAPPKYHTLSERLKRFIFVSCHQVYFAEVQVVKRVARIMFNSRAAQFECPGKVAALFCDTKSEAGIPEGIIPNVKRPFQAGKRGQNIVAVKFQLRPVEVFLGSLCLSPDPW